jgi:hypothetical protein
VVRYRVRKARTDVERVRWGTWLIESQYRPDEGWSYYSAGAQSWEDTLAFALWYASRGWA